MAVASLAILGPLVAAALMAALRHALSRDAAQALAVVVAGAVGVLCAVLVARSGGALPVLWLSGWTPVRGMPVGIALTPDAFGAGMATFAAVLTVMALVTARTMRAADDPLFDVLVLVLLAAMVAFCVSGDLFTLFVFFELMSVCAYTLVAVRAAERAPLQGGLTFAVTNSLAAIALLLGIALLYGRTGALNLARIGEVLGHNGAPDALVVVAFALIATGFLVKAAIVPFHFWLADAYAAASAPVCLLLAGAFTPLGLFGLARVFWTVFAEPFAGQADDLRTILVAVGLLTSVVGAVMALEQCHLRRMLAFVTVSTLGLFLAALGTLREDGVAGAALWVLADGCAKAALFVAAGALASRFGTVDAGALHGRGRDMPVTGAAFLLAGLAIVGTPPLGPFWAKALSEHAAELTAGYEWLPWAMTVPALLGGAAVLRAAAGIFAGVGRPPQADPSAEEEEQEARDDDRGRSPVLAGTAIVLALAAAAVTTVPALRDAASTAAAGFVDAHGYRSAVLESARAVPAHVAAPPPSALAWILGAVSTAGAVAVALFATQPVQRRRRLAPAPARAASRALRNVHSGHVGDYVLWFSTGLAALGGTCLALLT
jgi:multicomponent Na+:H+ antiporter subunit D